MLRTAKRWIVGMLPAWLVAGYRGWRLRSMLRQYQPRQVRHRYGSAGELIVHLADPLAEGWYDHDWDELPELAVLRQHALRPGAVVFDIGAHQGVVAMMLASAVGPTGKVVAIEANEHNATQARRNAQANGLTSIDVETAAIARESGTIVFNWGLNGQVDDGTGRFGRTVVNAVTLDDLAVRHGMPNVVFIDVEGSETAALAGGARVRASDADFFVEAHVGCGLEKLGGSVQQLLEYFPRDRYELFARAEGDPAFRPLADNDPLLKDRFFLLALRRRG